MEFFKKGVRTNVTIDPRAMCNSSVIEVAMVVQGIGITRLPLFTCEKEVANGDLKIILDDYDQVKFNVYAVYPHRQYLTAKVRAFVDFIVEAFVLNLCIGLNQGNLSGRSYIRNNSHTDPTPYSCQKQDFELSPLVWAITVKRKA
jgi:hypothetical protein